MSIHLVSLPHPSKNEPPLLQLTGHSPPSNLSGMGRKDNDDNDDDGGSQAPPVQTKALSSSSSSMLHLEIVSLMNKYQPLFVCNRNSIDPTYGAVITNHDPVLLIPILDTTTTTTSTPTTSNPCSIVPSRSASIDYAWATAFNGNILGALGVSGGSGGALGMSGGSLGASGGSLGGGGGSTGAGLRPEGRPRLSSIVNSPGK